MINREKIERLGKALLSGNLTLDAFEAELLGIAEKEQGFANLGETMIDLNRKSRCGFSEVVYAEGKSVDAIRKIFEVQKKYRFDCFATRLSQEKADILLQYFPEAIYNPIARTFRIPISSQQSIKSDQETETSSLKREQSTETNALSMNESLRESFESCRSSKSRKGQVAVLSAGTSDQPVAEEAKETVLWTGAEAIFIQDVGVAGPHRLAAQLSQLREADAIVVVAGMEGALPSVVGGYVSVPVIGVPTSVGYGTSFGGITALLGMLNSCSSNVCVVNIDAGFKAGYIAGMIALNRRAC
ncbi:MAG: nickel pincer cofactor biosynthesis protein LarB [Planctomycetia bacterium]|nr:nickel pincer cofactor biosynthesis protein LarB [Planctomycetia bacterium]